MRFKYKSAGNYKLEIAKDGGAGMKIKSINDIKNGDMVIMENGRRFIRVGDILIDDNNFSIECDLYGEAWCLPATKTSQRIFTKKDIEIWGFDIVSVWEPVIEDYGLSFDLRHRIKIFGDIDTDEVEERYKELTKGKTVEEIRRLLKYRVIKC